MVPAKRQRKEDGGESQVGGGGGANKRESSKIPLPPLEEQSDCTSTTTETARTISDGHSISKNSVQTVVSKASSSGEGENESTANKVNKEQSSVVGKNGHSEKNDSSSHSDKNNNNSDSTKDNVSENLANVGGFKADKASSGFYVTTGSNNNLPRANTFHFTKPTVIHHVALSNGAACDENDSLSHHKHTQFPLVGLPSKATPFPSARSIEISKNTTAAATPYSTNTLSTRTCKTPSVVAAALKSNQKKNAEGGSAEELTDFEKPVPFENLTLDHEKVDIRPTKNIKMKQHLCVKHAMPKTRLTNTILYENVSHDRHLEMKLKGLKHDKLRSAFTMDLNRRAFLAQQDRKHVKWRREDEVRVSAMNLPNYSPTPPPPVEDEEGSDEDEQNEDWGRSRGRGRESKRGESRGREGERSKSRGRGGESREKSRERERSKSRGRGGESREKSREGERSKSRGIGGESREKSREGESRGKTREGESRGNEKEGEKGDSRGITREGESRGKGKEDEKGPKRVKIVEDGGIGGGEKGKEGGDRGGGHERGGETGGERKRGRSVGRGGGVRGGEAAAGKRNESLQTLYHMHGAEYIRGESPETGARKPILPMMKLHRERTEIVSHHDKVFITRLPSVVEINQQKAEVHDTYCGKTLLAKGLPCQDQRFQRLHTTLNAAILNGGDQYPAANLTTKSRFSKYGPSSNESEITQPPSRHSEARVMVASRGKSIPQSLDQDSRTHPGLGSRQAASFDFVTERRKSEIGGSQSHTPALGCNSTKKLGLDRDATTTDLDPQRRKLEGEHGRSVKDKTEKVEKDAKRGEDNHNRYGGILKGNAHAADIRDDAQSTISQSTKSQSTIANKLSLPSIDNSIGAHPHPPTVNKDPGARDRASTQITAKTNQDILDLFKSKDLKSLARSLTMDAGGFGIGTGLKLGVSFRTPGTLTDRPVPMTTEPRPRGNPSSKIPFVPVVDAFQKVKTES